MGLTEEAEVMTAPTDDAVASWKVGACFGDGGVAGGAVRGEGEAGVEGPVRCVSPSVSIEGGWVSRWVGGQVVGAP